MEIWYTLTGEINKDKIQIAISWISSQIYSNQVESLKIFISSNGGDIDAAITFYDYLKALPFGVETYGFGSVDSAAILVFLAGEKRAITKDCRLLFHEGIYTFGRPTDTLHNHEENLNRMKYLLARMTKIISSEIKESEQGTTEMLKEGKHVTANEAKSLSICNEIIEKLPLKNQSK